MAIGWGFIGTGRHPDGLVAPSTALAADTELIAANSRDKGRTEAFNRAIQRDEEPVASGVDGLKIVQVTVAMIEPASTGRTIKLGPLLVS